MLEAILAEMLGHARQMLAGVGDVQDAMLRLIPFVLFIELPLYLLIFAGIARYCLRRQPPFARTPYRPTVSCIITCYSGAKPCARRS